MKLNISIEYMTAWGEELVLCLGGKRYPLGYVADGLWKGEIDRLAISGSEEYHYEVVREGNTVRKEWGKHILPGKMTAKILTVNDRWLDRPEDAPFYSSAFTKGIFGREKAALRSIGQGVNIQVYAPVVRPNEVLAIAGSGKALGNWNKVLPFEDSSFPDTLSTLLRIALLMVVIASSFVEIRPPSLALRVWQDSTFSSSMPSTARSASPNVKTMIHRCII